MKIDGNSLYSPAVQNAAPSSSASQSITKSMMGKDDFLKLFLTSLQYQDPSNAMDMNQMMNQMSQMSLMEQVQNMTKAVDAFSNAVQSNALEGGMKFLGKNIEAVDGNGNVIKGSVDQVRVASGVIQLVVGENVIPMQQVVTVSNQTDK